ncbi:NRT1 PTR FAMILY -like [Olea europaea subsp. europaea]|uniref:NRT1 PTR FAMILY -like n=1 Tax=Olea europaea subsp. europaea TaxID=158383 RepID=A0A8S0UJZ8_OLEEU|nr:NRT1 PTR FAMILY -like [Olea europaea subsp. europaea]
MKLEEKGTDYTQDGTVDLKGRPILRSNTGKWKACYFFVGYEIFERMAYYGIASNLVIYLTRKLHEGTVTSSNNVTNWGMCLLTLAVSLPGLRPPSCGHQVKEVDCDRHASTFQVGIFYCALYIIAVGTGGTKPNISTMGADQFDDFEHKERLQKLSFFNWWMFSVFIGILFSNTFLIYIQDNVGWELGYGLPTLGLTVSILFFIVGTRYYRHKPPSDSPLNRMARVLVATVRKWKVVIPDEPKELYELSLEEYSKPGMFRIDHTNSLSFLDRAAVKIGQNSPWMLCPVTQVEQTKQIIKMIPILLATFVPATMFAQTNTLFIKQGTTLEISIGPHFKIPPGCLSAFVTIFMLTSLVLYDRFFVPFVRRYTKNPRGITLLQRFGIGLVLHIIVMGTACLAERRRLRVAKENEIFEKNQIVPLSIFILLPQFVLMGVADTFVVVAKIEFFYDQAPEGMKSLGTAYFTTSFGVGYFISSFLLKTVADITEKRGKGWILDNLNVSRLDYYYAFLAVLCFLNLLYFLLVAKLFVYNTELKDTEMELHEAIEARPNKSTRSEEKTLDDKASS